MKTEDALLFWDTKVDLADYLGVDASQMSRFVRYKTIPESYDKKLKSGIRARMKKLNAKAEQLGIK